MKRQFIDYNHEGLEGKTAYLLLFLQVLHALHGKKNNFNHTPCQEIGLTSCEIVNISQKLCGIFTFLSHSIQLQYFPTKKTKRPSHKGECSKLSNINGKSYLLDPKLIWAKKK